MLGFGRTRNFTLPVTIQAMLLNKVKCETEMYVYVENGRVGGLGGSVLLYKISAESNDGHWIEHKERKMEID
jgi:hypothetical protein